MYTYLKSSKAQSLVYIICSGATKFVYKQINTKYIYIYLYLYIAARIGGKGISILMNERSRNVQQFVFKSDIIRNKTMYAYNYKLFI